MAVFNGVFKDKKAYNYCSPYSGTSRMRTLKHDLHDHDVTPNEREGRDERSGHDLLGIEGIKDGPEERSGEKATDSIGTV